MVTMGLDTDLIRELKHNWAISLVTDLTIASVDHDNLYEIVIKTYGNARAKSLYKYFDSKINFVYTNKSRKEFWKTRQSDKMVRLYGSDLDVDMMKVLQGVSQQITTLVKTFILDKPFDDQPSFDDLRQEMYATAYYNVISALNPNITMDMVKTSFGFWPREAYICKSWSIEMEKGLTIFSILQFFKIDSSKSVYECFVNELGKLGVHNIYIGNHAIEIEERNDLRGRVLKVARLKTYTTEDSSIYTIFMKFLASSMNAK